VVGLQEVIQVDALAVPLAGEELVLGLAEQSVVNHAFNEEVAEWLGLGVQARERRVCAARL